MVVPYRPTAGTASVAYAITRVAIPIRRRTAGALCMPQGRSGSQQDRTHERGRRSLSTAAPIASVRQAQQPNPPKLLLEEATKKEVVDGDLKGAIETYQKFVALERVPRAVVALTAHHGAGPDQAEHNGCARAAGHELAQTIPGMITPVIS